MSPQKQEQLIEIHKVLMDTEEHITRHGQVSWNSEVEAHFTALMDRLDWQVKVLGLDMQVDQLAREHAMYNANQETLQLLHAVHDKQASNQAGFIKLLEDKFDGAMKYFAGKFNAVLGKDAPPVVQMSAPWQLTKEQYEISEVFNEDKDKFVEDEIGRGGFGTVYRGKFEHSKRAAIKEMPISELVHFKNEVNMLYRLEHGNIVGCYGGRILKKTVHLVMPEMKCTLSDEVWPENTSAPPLTPGRKWSIILDVARGLAYLHSVPRIVHHDVKPDNVLISFKDGVCKLSDFGLASVTKSKITGRNTTRPNAATAAGNRGTENYNAPEVYDENQHKGRPVDVYAFGTLVFEVYTQTSP
jgi:hypothetical protein